jgi:hypothetical protein
LLAIEAVSLSNEIRSQAPIPRQSRSKLAHVDGDAIRREADEYVLETLRNLEMEMERHQSSSNGIRTLQEEKPKEL